MSFQNNNYWGLNGSGSLPNEMAYNTSTKADHKRGHQWFLDTAEHDVLFTKKQAIESVKETSVMDNFLWRGISSSQSGGFQTGDRLFSPKPVRCLNISNKDVSTSVSDFVNMEKNGYENQFGNDSSISLTMSNAVVGPLCLNTGFGQAKVNQVVGGTSENCLPELVGTTFYPGENNKLMGPAFLRTGNNIFPGPTYNTTSDVNSVGPDFSKMAKDFISVGQTSSKRDGNFMLRDQFYNNMLSIGQTHNKGNYNTDAVGELYEKGNGNFMSIGPTNSKGPENFFDPFYNKANETLISAASTYNKDSSSVLSMVENYKKGQQTTISFGDFNENNHEDSDPAGELVRKDTAEQLSANVVSATTSKTDGAQKTKEPKTKKGSSNNFPTNVKSLLSTGILDGVPVKYVSWSREKNLRGVVKGTGYLCSCQDCKLNKVINAFEFERHAGCKTKHPNNHIYFENGKTIYAVVQELKSTPQEFLFEVIQNVTGSPVNQKNFQTWKASYTAATRELQRIYGQDELIVQS